MDQQATVLMAESSSITNFWDMNLFVLASATDALAMGGGLFLIIGLILAALYALFPLIVMVQLSGLNSRLEKVRERLAADDKTAKAHAMDAHNLAGNANDVREDMLKELKDQNALTRQLLRAYGHNPEV